MPTELRSSIYFSQSFKMIYYPLVYYFYPKVFLCFSSIITKIPLAVFRPVTLFTIHGSIIKGL